MSAIGSLIFCADCGNLLRESTGDANAVLLCDICGARNKGSLGCSFYHMAVGYQFWLISGFQIQCLRLSSLNPNRVTSRPHWEPKDPPSRLWRPKTRRQKPLFNTHVQSAGGRRCISQQCSCAVQMKEVQSSFPAFVDISMWSPLSFVRSNMHGSNRNSPITGKLNKIKIQELWYFIRNRICASMVRQ